MTLEQEAPSRDTQVVYQTVAVVDMVGYSTLARLLEENSGPAAVAQLNRQIQNLIQGALDSFAAVGTHSILSGTGDGAILLFEAAVDAHCFAQQLHLSADTHNRSRTEHSATRWFRIGIASGELTRLNLDEEDSGYAGITIANAVRLESAARPGEIVVDVATFEKLPAEVRRIYAAEATVRGKRSETFRVHKYRVTKPPPAHAVRELRMSRRRMLGLATGFTGAAAAALWFEYPNLDRWTHPLPAKRYVALHAWPKPAEEMTALVNRIVGSIEERFIRAEPHDRQFVVLNPGDPLVINAGLPAGGETLSELAANLGANLVLAATSRKSGSSLHLTLQLLDAVSGKVLRHRSLSSAMSTISSFNTEAADAAARLLDLPPGEKPMADEEESATMNAEAYQLLLEGKHLVEEPNDTGLASGVEKLQRLVNEFPHFALGYAELAHAYLQQFKLGLDPARLELARQNTQHALQLNPDSSRAMLSQAKIDVFTGQTDGALAQVDKCLKLDPMNPEVLLYKAAIFRTLHRLPEEERVYRQIVATRLNYWPAYNELGLVLKTEARYADAIQAFSMASQLAPTVALPLTNLGMLYVETGRKAEAKESLERSLALHPNPTAYIGLGDLAFEAGDYKQAAVSFGNAHELKPKSDGILRDLGDCYTMLGQTDKAKATFVQAAEQLSRTLQINPKVGSAWMTLSFYHAKTGDFERAGKDMEAAEARGATDVDAQLTKAQTLAVMGRKEEALRLVLACLDRGLSTTNIDLAVDLREVRSDPRYRARVEHQATAI